MVVLGLFCVQKREWISIKVALDGEGFGWWVVVAGRKTSWVFCSFKECLWEREKGFWSRFLLKENDAERFKEEMEKHPEVGWWTHQG
jgi:hypothetical protein